MSCTTSTLYATENRVISFHKSKKIREVIQQKPEPIQNTHSVQYCSFRKTSVTKTCISHGSTRETKPPGDIY